jgi:signal transduction histidine kinase
MDLYTRDDQEHSSGFELRAHDYPRYFEAIASERVIVANNAHTSPLTSEFSETYLKPQNIMAMLDAPIRVEGKLVGVVCNEQTRKVRTWSVSDQMFAASIGDFAAQAIESARLAESRKTLARIRRIGQIGYWSLKLPNKEFQCSPELVQMLDDDLSNPINTLDSFIEHITAEDRQKFVEVVERSRSGIDNLEVEFDITTGDGIPRSMVCIIHLKFDFAQNLKGIHASCRDVTELSLMRLADAARIRAESAILTLQQHQDALTSTLATLVHDVRTPLTSIKLGLARLVDKRLNAEEILPAMRSEVEYMDALFSNLIALVRMDMDYARSSSEAYDLGRVLEQVQHRFQFLAEDNQIRLELALPEETAIQTGDTVAMQQAISNIVHNAIKFAQGNVAILLYSDKDTNIVEVRDDGPGFVDDEIERLRDRYFTGQQAPRVGRFGTGLGLTIANDLIIRMKGELLLMNDSEGGAHVQIRLPRED